MTGMIGSTPDPKTGTANVLFAESAFECCLQAGHPAPLPNSTTTVPRQTALEND